MQNQTYCRQKLRSGDNLSDLDHDCQVKYRSVQIESPISIGLVGRQRVLLVPSKRDYPWWQAGGACLPQSAHVCKSLARIQTCLRPIYIDQTASLLDPICRFGFVVTVPTFSLIPRCESGNLVPTYLLDLFGEVNPAESA